MKTTILSTEILYRINIPAQLWVAAPNGQGFCKAQKRNVRIVRKYPNFVLFDFGRYKMSLTYFDVLKNSRGNPVILEGLL